jgi:PTH1 family peptidyl-tRNA hydrolase
MASESPFLIVGLGNPGSEYENTPHNLGFHVVDVIAQRLGSTFSKKGKALRAEGVAGGRKIILLKPQTYMNLSGEAVREAVDFYKVDSAEGVCIIVDDLDLPQGSVRIRPSGSAGGHNGLKSIIQHLGGEGFPRIRIGIGREADLGAKRYVLKRMSKNEMKNFAEIIDHAASAALDASQNGILHSMNLFNKREKKNEP